MNQAWTAFIDKKKWQLSAFAMLACCYLLFPNNNPVLDAWDYAQAVKNGQELFEPHHLLYNYFFYSLQKLPFLQSIDTLRFMQCMNGLFVLASLYLLYLILQKLPENHSDDNGNRRTFSWTFLTGCSFACLRYGPENETYIIPVFFSLFASYLFLLFIRRSGGGLLLLSGLLAAVACLFHQLHFFWWLALLVGVIFLKERRMISTILFGLPALIVPTIYAMVLHFSEDMPVSAASLFRFALSYYFRDHAEVSVDIFNFILTAIGLVRTFFQVHGNIINFFVARPFLSLLSVAAVFFCLVRFLFRLKYRFSFQFKNVFINIHFLAFWLSLAFAFLSKGNAEFMVMLPFLMAICLSVWLQINSGRLFYFSVALLIWNMAFAVLPNHFYNFQNNERLIEIIRQYPDKKYILEEPLKITVMYKYRYAENISDRLFFATDSMPVKAGETVLTDVLTKKRAYNRGTLLYGQAQKPDYVFIRKVAAVSAFYGDYSVDEIVIRK